MKKLLIILLPVIFYLSSPAHAQIQRFAPVGAEWYYETQYGVFHSHVTKDTLVQGAPGQYSNRML